MQGGSDMSTLASRARAIYAWTGIYKYSFFPDTIRDWYALPAYIMHQPFATMAPMGPGIVGA